MMSRITVAVLGLTLFALREPASLSARHVHGTELPNQGAGKPFACSPAARPANLTLTLKDLDNADVTLSAF